MHSIDRRAFLRGAALIGASVASPGCFGFAPRRGHDVVVLGAGMAGLSAARRLHRAGLDVIVLEARDRVGGRMHSIASPAPHGIEIGAQMIHGSRAPTWELIHEFGIATRPMVGWNRFVQQADGTFLPPSSDLEARVHERVREAYRRFRGADTTLAAFLADTGLRGTELDLAFEDAYTWSAEPGQVSLRAAMEDGVSWDTWMDENYHVVGGYSAVAEGLARPLGPRIRLSSEVEAVEWDAGGVRVHYRRAGHPETLAARRALVTLPIGILQQPKPSFSPALPRWKRASIDALEMGRVVVVPMLFKRRFWRERDPAWQSWDTEHGRVSFWDPHPPGVGLPVLQCWTVGLGAKRLSDLGREAGLAQIMTWIEQAFPGVDARAQLEWWAMGDWVRDAYARGSYSFTRPGGVGQRAILATPIEERLYFAGEATAPGPHYQTVHGALMSGQRASREILAALGAELPSAPSMAFRGASNAPV
jgi:monoamine oxidase